ncbi:PorP/SprF family type IX secretion system membrane protein [Candidatus Sulfidibacterium hydrothermale]|uniref:PorP/SprF family type IX secretion system membrane protein n=1 Tax=Candidatus Sulfidibacterium hydrothermale TaxID=2875962 RepID=UPI001F0A43D8|nr:PorP/SprF family type IX secretion system membrane protein [Candidatus Sulfidibacterium hydrothermale]
MSAVFLLLSAFYPLYAQDITFSQFFNNPTYYNPAYVGLTTGLKIRFDGRRQWTSLPGDYKAYSFSADIADRNIPGAGGIGIIASSVTEGVGMLQTTTFGFMPSVRIQINGFSLLQFGALISVMSRQVKWENLVFSDQLDPRLGNISPSSFSYPDSKPAVFPDFSIGGIYQLKINNVTGTFGLAVHHITEPDQSFLQDISPLPRKWVAHMDFIIDFKKNRGYYGRAREFKIDPGILYQSQADMDLLAIGINAYVSNVYFGAWFRNEVFNTSSFTTLVWMVGLNIPLNNISRMKVMYSFDMNTSRNTNFTGPSHEISLTFAFDKIRIINPNRMRSKKRWHSPLECSPF